MSITVNSAPKDYGSAYNQLVFDITSSNTGQTNFNFVIDVYVGGVRVNRQLLPKQPASSSVKVDVSPIVKNYLSADFLNVSGSFLGYNDNSQVSYFMQFGEAYNNASGTLIIYPDLTRYPSGGQLRAYNCILDFEQYNPLQLYPIDKVGGFMLQTGDIYKYAGQYKTITYFDAPRTINGTIISGNNVILLSANQPQNLLPGMVISSPYFPVGTTITNYNPSTGTVTTSLACTTSGTFNFEIPVAISSVRIRQYSDAGSLLATTSQAITYAGGTRVYNINPEKMTGFSLNANTAYYDVELMIGANVAESKRIYITEPCTNYGTYRLHWLNQYGGWEAYNFTAVNQKSIEVNRTQYKKMLPLGYIDADRLKVNYNTEITDNVLINSDWITDAQSEWMQGLFESPLIWLERTPTDFIAVQITETSYQNQTYLNSGRQLHKITCNMQYSYNRYRQSL